ncbi:MAG: zinc-ribbon domain-containing protein [Lachnospiraceae bacterium]|nr:zinc-ribbon domain-containing protein [Lachnospiraceae bacterium]
MVCSKCGNENVTGTKFCIFCGQPLAEAAPVAETQVAETPVQENAVPESTPAQNNAMPGGAPMNGAPMQNNMMPGGAPMNGAPMQNNMMPGGAPMNGAPMQNNMMPGGAPMNGAPMQNNMMPGGAPMPNGAPMQGGIPMGNPMQRPMGAPMQGGIPMGNPNGGIPVGRPVGNPMGSPYVMGAVPPANPPQKKGGAAKVVIILLILLILVGIGVVAFVFISKNAETKKINEALQSAQELAEDGSYQDAEEAYLEVLEMQADNVEAIDGLTANYIAWADDYVADGDYEGALAVLEEADSQAKRKAIKEAIAEIEDAMTTQMVAAGSEFSDADLVFIGSSDNQPVELDHSIIVYSDVTYYTEYATANYDEYAEEYMTARGLELGMTLDDYVALYNVEEGYAAWELYSGSENEYTSFLAYEEGEDPAEMYYDYNNAWLDIGYCKEDGEWRQLEDWEVMDTWFCDAYLDDYEEVVVFAVNIDEWGEVIGISLEHFTYDEGWVEWQGWAE